MAEDTNASELPNLRFLDQTPIFIKQDAKRSKPDSSPLAESFNEENFLSKIDKRFEKSSFLPVSAKCEMNKSLK